MEAIQSNDTEGLSGWPPRFVSCVSLITCAVAVSVLVGTVYSIAALTTVVPGGSRMMPVTALAFLLTGISLGLTRMHRWRTGALLCAFLITLIGAFRLAAHAFGWHSNLDSLGLPRLLNAEAATGQMSPGTALSFALLGSALILAQRRRAPRLFLVLSVTALLLGWLGLTRYLYGGHALMPFAAMAVHTAALFLVLSAGVTVCRPDTPLIRLLASDGAGGTSARRMLPAAVLLPLALAWIPIYAGRMEWLNREATLAVFALLTAIFFGALIWSTALALERTDSRRKQAEGALRASEERTRLIIDSALDAVISIDGTGVVRGWNPQAESMFGWTREQAVGNVLADLIIPEQYRDAHRQGLRRFIETGEVRVLNQRIELTGRHRDNHEFPVEIAITSISADSGVAFSAFLRDITERRQTEDVLRESEGRLRTLAESLPHLVWTCKPDGWCDYLSRQWLDYTGRAESEQLGYGWAEQLHPDDRERVQREWAAATRRGDSFDTEFRIRRADGRYRWFKTRAVPFRNTLGHVTKWFGSNTDIEDYKAAERRLRAQLERMALLDRTTRSIGERQDAQSILQVVLRSLEDDLPIDFACVCLRDVGQRSLTVTCVGNKTQSIAEPLGLTERSALTVDENGLSRCLRGHLVYEPDITQAAFAFPKRLAQGGLGSLVLAPLTVESKVFGVLVAARRGTNEFDGDECEFLRQLSEHVALSLHQAELYLALQSAYEDIRRTQQAVVQQERLRALGQMAGGIAHDINNSLSSASLYVDALLQLDDNVSGSARADLAVVQRALTDVAETVARMRAFYRPQEPALTHHRVNLNDLVDQVMDLTRARWYDMPQERGAVISVQKELAPDPPWVGGAEGDIRDALTNLVLNAVDAMPDGGRLTLRTRAVGDDRACVEVADTGIGMSEEVRTRCLEPFFTTKGERGTGLGLAMVYGMIERHGADIQIESEPGRGTNLRLVFPIATGKSEASGLHPVLRPRNPLKILLVDDDPMVLKSLRDILERDGHCVTAADGGSKGIDTFRATLERGEHFSIVITDLGMPNIDGRSVAAAIKESEPRVPVVLLTGWGQRFLVQNDVPPYVDRVLSKPAKLSDIRLALAELVSK